MYIRIYIYMYIRIYIYIIYIYIIYIYIIYIYMYIHDQLVSHQLSLNINHQQGIIISPS